MTSELQQIFTQEASELFAAMEETLVRVEGVTGDEESARRLLTAAHNFKGNASVLGYGFLEELAHALEDFLLPLRDGAEASPGLISVALEAVDALRRLVPAAVAGAAGLGPADRALLERLRHRDLSPARAAVSDALLGSELRAAPATQRVSLSTLDRMLTLTGELLVARSRLGEALGDAGPGAREAFEDTDRLFADLHELVMKARMVSLGPVLRQFLQGHPRRRPHLEQAHPPRDLRRRRGD